MLPRRPAHIPQDIWELELPSILGVAHPRCDDLDHDDGLDSVGAAGSGSANGMMASGLDVDNSRPPVTSVSDSDSQECVMLAAPPSPVRWSDLWNIPSDDVVHTVSMELGVVPAPPGPQSSDLDWMAYQLCCSGRCALSHLAQLCLLLPNQQVAKRRKRSTSDGGTVRNQTTFSVGAFAAGGTQGVQLNTCAHLGHSPAHCLDSRGLLWSSLLQLLSAQECDALQTC